MKFDHQKKGYYHILKGGHVLNTNLPSNLWDEEFKALQNLSMTTKVIQKSDKENSVVILDTNVYIKHMDSA